MQISFNKNILLESLRLKISYQMFILVLSIILLLVYWPLKTIGSGESVQLFSNLA